MERLFGQVYAPSTLGSFLREFTFGHVRSSSRPPRSLLVSLAMACPRPGGRGRHLHLRGRGLAAAADLQQGQAGVGFGHTKVGGYPVLLRGLSSLVATISTDTAAPVIAATRLRGGNAGSARGAASLVAEALGTARALGTGPAPGVGLRCWS